MKVQSLLILLVAEVAALSLWFLSSAILPDMLAEVTLSEARQAALSSAVQAGFVIGALVSAIFGLSDRYDPRRLFALTAIAAGLINLSLAAVTPGGNVAIAARFATGVCLAGVYPVGMKIAVSWGKKDRGFLVGALVGALTLGSALPHMFVFVGGANWRVIVVVATLASIIAGLLVLLAALGPHYTKAARFNPQVMVEAWTNRRVRLAYIGYLGHMWELYAMWAWIAAIALASYTVAMPQGDAQSFATLTAFLAIGAGGPMCVAAGYLADRFGKAEVAAISMAISGSCAVLAALTFGGPVWLSFVIFILWGISIVPDSALFSALVADAAPPDQTGSLMTLQTALGFALTIVTVQITPIVADLLGWPVVLAALAIGPVMGIVAMMRLRRMGANP